MKTYFQEISKQIYKEDILNVMEKKYSTVGPMWVSNQMEWNNGIYASFKDHDKFMILIFLIKKTLDFYSRNSIKLTYDEFYKKNTFEIERFNITEISTALNIPKESARRKIIELVKDKFIKKVKKRFLIDRSKFDHSRPFASIKRTSRFLSILSQMCNESKILSRKLNTTELEVIIKKNFSDIWKLYYEMQIPMMIKYKKIFTNHESFHIWGTCIVNQHLYAKNIIKDYTERDTFIASMYAAEMQGLNAMSISDITGIPRATVIRKLKILVTEKFLMIDKKKHYKLTGFSGARVKHIQNEIFIKLSYFSAKIFNLSKL
tara:strand:- start:313 stop:1266 length:954 start_codon:yes stop_codon:yes gene_type:complete